MSRYDTETWKELEKVQNELAMYAPIDILTITGFMQTHAELEKHLEVNKQTLQGYKNK